MRKDINLRYQNATTMLTDLRKALKDPDGDFVDNQDYNEDMPTQKISIKDIEEEAAKTKNDKKKKQNKLVGFIKKHKKLSIFIGLILLFALSLGGTVLYSHLTNPKEVLLPNLVGISEEDAAKTVEELGLVLEVTSREYNSEYAEGYIISQDPLYSDNYNVKMGSTIKIVVSQGIEEAVVPNVVGKSKDEATKLIEEAKLKYEIVEEESKKIEAGYVVSQEIEPETTVYAGDTVVIHVSTGVKKVSVTSVIGKQEEEAKNTLSSLGLAVTVAYDEDSSKDNGVVLKQSIDAGKEVEEGTGITLTVNKLTETKSANLTVNVKSLYVKLYGNIEYEENTSSTNSTNETNSTSTTPTVKNVTVRIVVGEDTVYRNSIDPTTTNLYQTISGKGTVTVKVYIDDVVAATKDVNLNNTRDVLIE